MNNVEHSVQGGAVTKAIEGAARPQFTQGHARSHDAAEKPQERVIGTVIFTTVHSRGHGRFNWLDHRILLAIREG